MRVRYGQRLVGVELHAQRPGQAASFYAWLLGPGSADNKGGLLTGLYAMAALEELEETARLVLLAQGECPPLTAIQIEELRQTFGARW